MYTCIYPCPINAPTVCSRPTRTGATRQKTMFSPLCQSNCLIDPASGDALLDEQPHVHSREVDEVIHTLKSSSKYLRGCYAAVKSSVPGGRALIRSILNLSLLLQLVASVSALREFNPIR